MELNELRVQIDEIDRNIVELFSKRMEVVKDIALCKKDSGKKDDSEQSLYHCLFHVHSPWIRIVF